MNNNTITVKNMKTGEQFSTDRDDDTFFLDEEALQMFGFLDNLDDDNA